MKPTSGSKGRTDICTEPWIPQDRRSISCSRPNATLPQPSDSFVRRYSTQPIRNPGNQRGQEPSVSGRSGGAQGRRHTPAPLPTTPVQILNNVVEQDHRVPKKRVWLAKGYQSFLTAWRTLQGIEAVHMIRKGRARWVGKGDPLAQLQLIEELFGLAI